MPLPLILGAGAALVGLVGLGATADGAVKMISANDMMKRAETRHAENLIRFEKQNKVTTQEMDRLGKLELEILHSFGSFSDVFEQIKNKPVFATYTKDGVQLPRYDGEDLKTVSVGAGVLLGGLSGAALGTAGGFAAAGATTAAVMALGTASTGTAIASLSGAALTNATLAALGGGALSAGGGGMALGSTILGATTLGVGLLVGGVIFSVTGEKLSDKAEEAWAQMEKAEKKIDETCEYLIDLRSTANRFYQSLATVNDIYQKQMENMSYFVNTLQHTDWNTFSQQEKQITENTSLLVGLLYNMCKVELVLKTEIDGINKINEEAVEKSISDANTVLTTHSWNTAM